MTAKPLPPEVRRQVNKAAHRLAMAYEVAIRDRLTAQAVALADSSPDAAIAALGLRAFTDADWQAVTMTDAELLGWLDAHAIELTD